MRLRGGDLNRIDVYAKHFFNLDIGLPVERLNQSIRACLTGNIGSYEATNRRGKLISCKVICTSLVNGDEMYGVIMMME